MLHVHNGMETIQFNFLTDFHAFIASLGERRPTFQETSVALAIVNTGTAMSIVCDGHRYCQLLKYYLGIFNGINYHVDYFSVSVMKM